MRFKQVVSFRPGSEVKYRPVHLQTKAEAEKGQPAWGQKSLLTITRVVALIKAQKLSRRTFKAPGTLWDSLNRSGLQFPFKMPGARADTATVAPGSAAKRREGSAYGGGTRGEQHRGKHRPHRRTSAPAASA